MEIGTRGRLAAFLCWQHRAVGLGEIKGRFQKCGLQMHANGSYRAYSFESDLTRDAIQRGVSNAPQAVTAINDSKRCRIESA